jgi:hypothetical protein
MAGQVNIVVPPSNPSPYPEHRSFSTWGTVTNAVVNKANMSATVTDQGGNVHNGTWSPQPPPNMQWQFDFIVPASVTSGTLQVNCVGANAGTRNLTFS